MTELAAAPHFSFSLQEQIGCVRREISMRRRVYPNWVRNGRMKLDGAEREIALMEAVLSTLLILNERQTSERKA